MSVTNSIVDFFQGNPFNNPIGSLIEKSTDVQNEAENWTLFMETCDVINSTEDGPKLAIRAIKRRINSEINRTNIIVSYTLTLLETCVKNCEYRFHLVVCTKDFLQDFERILCVGPNFLINGKPSIPGKIRDKILYLVQNWFDLFKGQPDLKEIEFFYYRLLELGFEFPMQDIDKLEPRNISKKPETPIVPKPIVEQKPVVQQKPSSPKPVQSVSIDTVVEKLSNDLQVVQRNIDVLKSLMDDYPSNGDVPDEALSLMKNLKNVCLEMQTRLMELINVWGDGVGGDKDSCSVLPELLRINDEMNSVLAQYDRYERTVNGKNVKTEESETSGSKDVEDLQTRIKKSNLIDVYAAQQETEHFYDGIMSSTHNNNNQDPVSGAAGGQMSSIEFDRFLNDHTQNGVSTENDKLLSDSVNIVPNSNSQKPSSNKQEIFEL